MHICPMMMRVYFFRIRLYHNGFKRISYFKAQFNTYAVCTKSSSAEIIYLKLRESSPGVQILGKIAICTKCAKKFLHIFTAKMNFCVKRGKIFALAIFFAHQTTWRLHNLKEVFSLLALLFDKKENIFTISTYLSNLEDFRNDWWLLHLCFTTALLFICKCFSSYKNVGSCII